MKFLGFTLLFCFCGTQASILFKPPKNRNSYENIPVDNPLDYPDIKDNLIFEEYDITRGLFPPKPHAKDYYDYSSYKEKPVPNPAPNKDTEYVIDTVNKVLRLNTEEGSQETKLKPVEQAEIKKLSAAFAKLFENSKLENYDWDSQTQTQPPVVTEIPEASSSTTEGWENLKPIITVSKSGVAISFGNETDPEEDETSTTDDDTDRDSLWDSLSKSVDKVLEDELDRRLNMTNDGNSTEEEFATEAQEEKPSNLVKFVKSVWNLMTSSLDYVAAFFSNLMSGGTEAAEAGVNNSTNASTSAETEISLQSPTTTVAVFAFEEPTSFQRLPSEEFEKRGRDVDSLYYGYGIA